MKPGLRRKARPVKVASLTIGGDAPISVQSMTKTDTRDRQATLKQIRQLHEAGCELVRLAVPDRQAADAFCLIRKESPLPLVADIHFSHTLALRVLEGGADKLRINPGNIGNRQRVEEVVRAAKDKNVPIRIGVNGGSLEKDLLAEYGGATPEAMVESAMRHIRILEDLDYPEIVISLKASDIHRTVQAYRLLADRVPYPFHLGVTEAGSAFTGTIKSSIGLGILLMEGIGDTIRISLTADSVEEIRVGREILKSVGRRNDGPTVVACPTCGRSDIDMFAITDGIERGVASIRENLKLAVMGCVVNGPGESVDADLGIAPGKGVAMLYKEGKPYRKVAEKDLVEVFVREAKKMAEERRSRSLSGQVPKKAAS